MATTQAKANPKKSSGFQGVKNAFFIILVCFVLAVLFFKYILGAPEHFVNGDPTQPVKDGNLMGTVYKGGVVVPVIITLLFSVIALSIERFFALRTAFGKSSLGKFVISVKKAIVAGDMAKAQELCDKQQGSVANVVGASIAAYKEMENTPNLKRAAKVSKIQQAHEEATQLEMPTLQMNMPIIATIVTLGTLTALFGTVVGMIRSFAALASGGGGDSLQLSEGISEALVNTASGILTSWVAVVSYNYYSNKIDKLTYALDEVGYTIAKTYEANHADEA
ncbi:MAG: MotA/TolQ/ExbB proton channel family protein [Prevotella stercorea]|jgi:biopolymer transport protein ExbB|uniref:MotA/TolQ/ExbB proton channel family protein n=2 Tax=Prevotellaceae TaxID=171552 RepID=UPI00033CF946|nr:MotA/TolQ/ExbB proton channel family protein [Leyella stercorea]MCI5988238.1 MotA/TolQ/ExbB proton channel family protein [Prevotella sp.]CDB03905.1 transporter MotA/TolQ/ExbB proton channel family protein [Prevotella sp. CAG:520]MBU9898338.1 MotA/TolQ/ExbB proton channel family protein [Leyella stercorea]MBU9946034.1 MotA/TolQ/ExbB proton channel family protein [Leyella stercorea]MCI6106576.1 MotA/TolQ/ExbB proton channel family protein [Prevotella sp.]